jgi:glutathione synthase
MKIAFAVGRLEAEQTNNTTAALARAAVRRGHEVWLIEIADLESHADGTIRAWAHWDGRRKELILDQINLFWVRHDPAADAFSRSWAQPLGFAFGQALQARGVTVLNDPGSLARAVNNTIYTTGWSYELRPATLVTGDTDRIVEFAAVQPGDLMVRPLLGREGLATFLLQKNNEPNLRQIVEMLRNVGLMIAQEHLANAVRVFLLEGEPLGAAPSLALEIGARLARDGMFLASVDIATGKLVQANVFCPEGLPEEYADRVIARAEKKVGI